MACRPILVQGEAFGLASALTRVIRAVAANGQDPLAGEIPWVLVMVVNGQKASGWAISWQRRDDGATP
jgi:hypothetical protein